MKLKLLTILTLLASIGLVTPAKAQNAPTREAQVTGDEVLEACAENRADTLPNPFSDVSPDHWAYQAVLSMYYCGAYRGAIPPEQVKPFLRPQSNQPAIRQSEEKPTDERFDS